MDAEAKTIKSNGIGRLKGLNGLETVLDTFKRKIEYWCNYGNYQV
jgi:hypothetical protein